MKFERGAGIFAVTFSVVVIVAALAFAIYVLRVDSIIRHKFEGQRWDIPAKVFARPLEIYNQAPINQADFQAELELLGYKASENYSKSGSYVENGDTIYIHTRGFDFGDSQEPQQILQVRFMGEQIAEVRATRPSSTGIARLEPLLIGGIYPQHNEDRVLIKLNKVPKTLVDALISTEDRNFYQHHGISIRGTARALVSNVTGGKRQGGSTLTQQLVKNFYLSPERTIKRKVNEALMAVLLELHYSKSEILEAYLNEVNLGQNGNVSINGYGLAAQYYFGLPLSELNIAQQAYLVGLVQGPSLYNPWRNPELALKRRNVVLNNMLVTGYLNQQQYDKEVARPLGVLAKPSLTVAKYPDFLDIVRRQLRSDYQETDLTNQGLRIFTTLDPLAQSRVETSFKASVAELSKRNPKRLQDLQGAVLVAKPENGELVAAVGSTQNFTGFNRALDAKRQVGSLLKPIIYLNALESGRYNWTSPVEDTAIRVPSENGFWTPKNYDGIEHGVVSMRQALANSYNLSAVRLGQEFGVDAFVNQLRKFGVRSDIVPYPSIFLGSVNLSPMEILGVYENFATGGFNYPTRAIRSVVDAKGNLLQRYALDVQQSIDPAAAYVLNFGLQQVMDVGTGRAAYNRLATNLRLAGKSGTTNDTRDAWFAGYSGSYVTVVWLGKDDNSITGLTGSSGALPVWANVMAELKQKPVQLKMNDNVQWQWIDTASGYLSAENCEGAVLIPMLKRSVPQDITPCGLAALTVDASAPAALPDGIEPNLNDNNGYIQDSEPTQENDLPNSTQRVISSGRYDNTP